MHRLRERRNKEAKFLFKERTSMGPVDPEDLVMLMVSPCNSPSTQRKKRAEKSTRRLWVFLEST